MNVGMGESYQRFGVLRLYFYSPFEMQPRLFEGGRAGLPGRYAPTLAI